jgi:hypothetical protein
MVEIQQVVAVLFALAVVLVFAVMLWLGSRAHHDAPRATPVRDR